MTTPSLLTIGSSALAAAQGSLATVSHNIANANTAGYSRQEAQLATAGGLFTGAGFFGRGVDLTTVRRQYDQFLTGAVQSAASASAADRARASGLKALDDLFASGDQGVGAALDQLFSAAGDLANRPADASARQVFIARAGDLATRITTVGRQVAQLAQDADGRLAQDAAQANAQLATIAKLNARIAQGQAQGQPPNDLLDQRDAAIQALGAFLAVKQVRQDDGSISLFTEDGAALLVGQQQARLDTAPDPADASHGALRLTFGTTTRWLDQAALGGGSLAGTLRLRDDDLTAASNQLGRLAQVVASAFNAQQALGVDMDGNAGAALFQVPDAVARPGSGNAGAATLAAGIVDASALRASDYDLQYDGAAWQITRLADGRSTSTATLPATVDGLQFAATGAAAAGDRWRVQPFAAAATGLAARPLAPRQVATGSAATVPPAAANPGNDNRNALALAALGSAPLVDGATLNEAYAALVGDVGARVQSGQAAAEVSGQLQDEAVARQQAVAGVDLDEEAANLLRFQQAYQASARIIQASQSLFQSLLAAVGS
jgi:flagellar hook-associated protein 1 FlgK